MDKNNIELKFNNFTDVVTYMLYLSLIATTFVGIVRFCTRLVVWSWTGVW